MKTKKVIKQSVKLAANPKYAKKTLEVFAKKRSLRKSRRKEYISWFNQQQLNKTDLTKQKELARKLKIKPLISIILPTYNTNPKYLKDCIESVISQTYTNWELCISDDASPNQNTKDVIKEYVKTHKNIKAIFNKKNQHIAGSSNTALTMAKGDFIALLDHDDMLLPNALYETVLVINQHPDADLIYTDEDKLEDDKYHVEPFFKPDWSPDFLDSCNYITHFATLSSKILKEVNGFTPGSQGAQDWDLFLRVTQRTDKIHHISKILYTWRKSETSTAQSADTKPYAYINQKKVLRNSIVARGVNAAVEAHPSLGFWKTTYGIAGTPIVSIVIPTKDNLKFIQRCVDSILEKTTYPYFEVVIVDTGTKDKSVLSYYDTLTKDNSQVKIVKFTKKFNFSEACNYGADKSRGEYLLFLNDDTKVITSGWLQGLLGHAQRPEIGMVGPRLLFPDGTIQHAGIVLSEKDVAFHPFYKQDPLLDIFNYIYIANTRNVAAVTAACSMISRKKFNEVNGFDAELQVTYNDVDLCIRLLEKGYMNVYNPFVQLHHYESVSVGKVNTVDRDGDELSSAQDLMRNRWPQYLKRDPYYNPCFKQYGPGYRL